MESFGLWYEPASTNGNDVETEEKLSFQIHFNLWSKLKVNSFSEENTYLDIGIKIKNYKSVDKLIFMCPFEFSTDDIYDLSEKLSNKKNANIVFNNECEIETRGSYTIIKDSDKNEELLLYPFEQAVQDVRYVEQVIDENYKLVICFEKFKEYIKRVDEGNGRILDKVKDIYIRFRIKSSELKNKLFSELEPLNKCFESGFISTQIIDFKINDKRNISNTILARTIENGLQMVKFESIHFLLMEPSCNDVICISSKNDSCRNLEKNIWSDYLNIKDVDKSNVNDLLAYHWKYDISQDKNKEQKEKSEFSQLVKINYSKTNIHILSVYAIVVILFGFISGLYANIVNNFKEDKTSNLDVGLIGIFILIFLICIITTKPVKRIFKGKKYKKNRT